MEMSLKEILGFIMQGGTAIVVFVIWYFSYTRANKDRDEQNRQQLEQQRLQNATSEAAFKKHTELNAELIQLLKDDQDYKLQLAGILDRITIKLETPAQCPILMTGKKFKLEVTE